MAERTILRAASAWWLHLGIQSIQHALSSPIKARQSGDTYDAITSLQHRTAMTNVGSAGITSRPTSPLEPPIQGVG